jgi:membrane-bound lytic murein transglycosylase MltF
MSPIRRWTALTILAASLCGCGVEPPAGPLLDQEAEPARTPVAAAPPLEAPGDPLRRSLRLDEIWFGDLTGIVERGRLRVLVTYSLTNYFLDGARPRGITHDLVEEFVRELNRSLGLRSRPIAAVYIPVRRDDLLRELAAGRGDVAAANLTVTESREATVDFSAPLTTGVRELVVTGPGGPDLERLEDLSGTEIWVRPSSSYGESLAELNERFRSNGLSPVRVRAADEHLETEDILQLVNAGSLPATVADSHLAAFWSSVLPDVKVHEDLALRDGGVIAWALRKDTPELAEAVNTFARKNGQGTLVGQTIYARYLRSNPWVRNPRESRASRRLQGMVELFQKYGDRYDFDWRWLAAQGYQESGLDQSVVSRAGAIGVMQLLPRTATHELGMPEVRELESNIHAGAKYLRRIVDTYFDDPSIDELNRQLFAAAAYNAGPSRIRRLRGEAEGTGLDPNRWFENVEVVVARRVGAETVRYVANVYKYYVTYRLDFEHQERRRRLLGAP